MQVRRLREDVRGLDRAIHNGLSDRLRTLGEDVAVIKATCHERECD